MPEQAKDYLADRGIKDTDPEALNESLRRVLDGMEPMLQEAPGSGLSAAEQQALVDAGLRLERTSGRDLVAENTVRFAALVEHSLTAEQVAEQIDMTSSRVRQLIATRELYSFLLNGKRLMPDFQIRNGKLIPNIGEVNRAIPESMHPLGVYSFYHLENDDLCIDDDQDVLRTPLDWLAEGRDPRHVTFMAEHL